MTEKIKLFVAGAGNMGTTHALSAMDSPDFELVGIATPGDSKNKLQAKIREKYNNQEIPVFGSVEEGLEKTNPNALAVASTTGTHEEYTRLGLSNGLHVFCEKPLAPSVNEAKELAALSEEKGKVLTVGYVLRHSVPWGQFVEEARTLGGPYNITMSLNQRSDGETWETHKKLIEEGFSPVVDCSPHYIDIAMSITGSRPVTVFGTGMKHNQGLEGDVYDRSTIAIVFEDGSVFNYQANWGPGVSAAGFSTKKVEGLGGFVHLEYRDPSEVPPSDEVESHVGIEKIVRGSGKLDRSGRLLRTDAVYDCEGLGGHNSDFANELYHFGQAIRGNVDYKEDLRRSVEVTELALLAHQSAKEGKSFQYTS